jgi:hypothetical protein
MRDTCATCGITLHERSPNSPEVRYCQTCWWTEQLRRFDAGEPINPNIADWFTAEPNLSGGSQWRGVRHV